MRDSTPAPCITPGCGNPSRARRLCKQHYQYHYQRGTLPPRKYLTNATARYEHWIDRSDADGCWIWTGALSSGYGVMTIDDGSQEYVHRWAYERFVGPVPDGLQVGHVCHDLDLACIGGECVHRRCSRPDHLKPMTIGDNVRAGRAVQRKRETCRAVRESRTTCANGHEWVESNIYIRPTDNAYICRECVRDAKARYREKNGLISKMPRPRDRTHCRQGHEYDSTNSQGVRICKTCMRAAQARYRQRRREQSG